MCWKNAYLEKYIQERFETAVVFIHIQEIPKEELIDELKALNKYIYNLTITEMK
jgi:hypothetical protein